MNVERIAGGLAAAMLLAAVIGCNKGDSTAPGRSEQTKTASPGGAPQGTHAIKALHFVSGNIGDQGFFDSAERGMKKASFVYGFET